MSASIAAAAVAPPRHQPVAPGPERHALVAFNPFATEFLADPYPTYARLRRSAPLFGIPGCRGRDWIVTSHTLVADILSDARFGIDDLPRRITANAAAAGASAQVDILPKALSSWLFFIDPPRHSELRRQLACLFRRPFLDTVARALDAAATRIVGASKQTGILDVVGQLAAPLPALATSLLMGAEPADLAKLATLSTDVFEVFAQPLPLGRYLKINARLHDLYDMIGALADSPTLHPHGLLRSLQALHREGSLTQDELLAVCGMLFSVGQDTAQGLIANAVLAMVRHPRAVLAAARAPSLLPLLRELGRYDPPVQMVMRLAKETIGMAGQQIQAGERVHLFLGSALRDETVFTDAASFLPSRAEISVLQFGGGVHFCLGSQLAMLELEAVVKALLPELPEMVLDEDSVRRADCTHLRRARAFSVRWQGANVTASPH